MAGYRVEGTHFTYLMQVHYCSFVCCVAGWTPLMYASYVGHDTIVNLLLDTGVDPSRGTPSGLTPLMVAAGCGNESVCYFLLHVRMYNP